ncbi:outer membrane-stress sensor serine endopeptidase DegS [Mannheimia massilioguelmaensis]|uniref:outer membrane-stress sensor serine endopeptidase DegS n=1 Tax=Mannheimia massilioguelmaensis TaxID=1604354 RepID=UPI0005C9CEE5|nr:outer membrane-stress sensor serine endopeptidase DegS [Mannheimia massilioguelmaensis]
MLKKIIQAAIIGLACAGLVLAFLPKLSSNHLGFSLYVNEDSVLSFKNAVRIASPAVVNVYNQSFSSSNADERLQVNSLGSGVIMSKDGYILTNMHVIQNADQIVVALQNGIISEAALIGSDKLTDLAVLKIRAENLPTIPQNPSRQIHVGDVVLAIGNPYNLGQSVSQGIISATGRNTVGDSVGRQNFIQTDASINRGNSGGALINSLGELVGISTLSFGKDASDIAEGLNFAIPMNIANDVLNKIIRDGRVIRGFFGVQSNIIFNENTDSQAGVKVGSVVEDGPAAKAGIQPNDIILEFNNEPATSPAQMMQVISNVRPGSVVNVLIEREGRKLTIPVQIEEFPESIPENNQ